MKGLPNSFSSPSNRKDDEGDPISPDEEWKIRQGCQLRVVVFLALSLALSASAAFGAWDMMRRFPSGNIMSGLPMGPYYWWTELGLPFWLVHSLVAFSLAAYGALVFVAVIWARPKIITACALALVGMVILHFQGCSRSYAHAQEAWDEALPAVRRGL